MKDFLLSNWGLFFLLVAAGLPLLMGVFVTRRRVNQSIELASISTDLVDKAINARQTNFELGDSWIPCALSRNVPWQTPGDMARAMIIDNEETILIVDFAGSGDFSFEAKEASLLVSRNLAQITGTNRNAVGPSHPYSNRKYLIFLRTEDLSELPEIPKGLQFYR